MPSPSLIPKKTTLLKGNKRKNEKSKYRSRKVFKDHVDKYSRLLKVHEDVLFPPAIEESGANWLDENNISYDHIARHVFEDSCRIVRIGRASGDNCCCCLSFFIRLCIKLKDKLKTVYYLLLQKRLDGLLLK